jgi:uncharacterized protein (TIGR02569 family)
MAADSHERAGAASVPREVLAAFGVDGDPVGLDGGEGLSFRVADVVVKKVHDVTEAEWSQDLLSRVEQEGFRVPEPIRARDGRWVYEGWAAACYLYGLRPAVPDWEQITAAGLRFVDAGERVRQGGVAVLAGRSHRWAIADRVAWAETKVTLTAEATDIEERLTELLGDRPAEEHLVHGDLSGNVCLDPAGVPVVLDFSPYLRPRRWTVAIVIADAVLWNDAPLALASSFAEDVADRDLLIRALIFRMVAEQLASAPRHGAHLHPYREVLKVLADL